MHSTNRAIVDALVLSKPIADAGHVDLGEEPTNTSGEIP
jgi:hypothetical protein